MISKEKIEELIFYSVLLILILVVFYGSMYLGSYLYEKNEIPIGQEYQLKDIIKGPNSTFTIAYYDNDANKTVRYMIPTGYIEINFTQYNSSVTILRLEKIEKGVNYWTVYIPKE